MEFKEIKIDTDLFQVYINNELIDLTKKEYYLLLFFLNNRNKVFTRQELINEVWNENITEKAVDTCISRLKKKMKDASKYIMTRKGFGFAFIEQ